MGLFKKNENEKKHENDKQPILNAEKTLTDDNLDKVAGGMFKVGIGRPKNDGSGITIMK